MKLVYICTPLKPDKFPIKDIQKKLIAAGKIPKREQFVAELGDLLWYVGNLLTLLEIDINEVISYNVEKMKSRYGHTYSHRAAISKPDKLKGGF